MLCKSNDSSVKGGQRKSLEKCVEYYIIFCNMNTLYHKAEIIQDFLAATDLTQLPYPPYSPELAPYDFFFSLKIKELLKGKRF